MSEGFRKAAHKVSQWAGSAGVFLGAVAVVLIWAGSGPAFNYSDTWQLVINTGTTIVTFLMVFLIQNTQNRDGKAMQLKLDELIRSTNKARDSFIDLESLTDAEIAALEVEFRELRTNKQVATPNIKKLHATIEAEHNRRLNLRSGISQIAGHVNSIIGVVRGEIKDPKDNSKDDQKA